MKDKEAPGDNEQYCAIRHQLIFLEIIQLIFIFHCVDFRFIHWLCGREEDMDES